MLILILTVLSILLWTHLFIYYFVIIIFWITKYKLLFFIMFLFLSFTFVLSSILVHYFNNYLTRVFYYIASIWLWILSNLFFLLLFLIIIFNFSTLVSININLKLSFIFIIFFSIIITLYWIYNANNPIIKNVNINIKNLPDSWKSKKIVFISDIHIWAIIREKFLKKIALKIKSQDPDLVFITGDLFDWTDWELDHMWPYIDLITARQWVYYVNWNHETYLWKELSKQLLSKTQVKILEDEIVNIDWVQIIWLSFVDDRFWKKGIRGKLSKLSWFNKDIPSILLYHAPVFLKEFRKFGINLQLSWHTHKWQIWPFGYITKIIYKWKDYGLYKKNDYNLYTTNWIWTWWPPLRTWNKPEIVILNLK